ncbi:MAG: NAD(P)-dependent alcohol dehydrogenase, partial [Bacteroidota bacterium]
MKAIVCSRYGTPDSLQLQEVEKPSPKKDEVLVKVHATSINDWDWGLVRGKPNVLRLLFGILKPKKPIPGIELSGIVEEIGEEITRFKVGDKVYGDLSNHGWGSWCEYACAKEDSLTIKPEQMSFEEAAATPHAALLAYQGLLLGNIKGGMEVLVNGAGGGMGTFAFQILQTFGATITGVDSGHKLNMMREMGADEVIDYTQQDFTKTGKKYDLVLDAKTTRAPGTYLKSLKPDGKYITVGGHYGKLARLFLGKKGLYKEKY